uniref:Uncharacterized protein n=1 Tax=Amphimedon queenslandica TaxID=400682 RepID=A0A1X7UAX9_AMPQE
MLILKLIFSYYEEGIKGFAKSGELAHRWSINCCNYIYNHWSPLNAYPIIIGWEYYQKNMNNSFVISDFENKRLLISESGYKDVLEAIGSSDQLTSSLSSSSSSSSSRFSGLVLDFCGLLDFCYDPSPPVGPPILYLDQVVEPEVSSLPAANCALYLVSETKIGFLLDYNILLLEFFRFLK